ncbi:MAG TPA: 50S ribosomal protein L22 [Candidatus Moranbacteria bacterium]|nr:50S ribosomal protein L22 [Candidatus Moranbacteria bacterium]
MKVKVKLKNLRISPRKVRVSADMIRGCMVEEAIFRLENTTKRANEVIVKLLKSAKADAINNFKLDGNALRVSEILVGEGATLKRWRPRAYGRASQILKRSSHIYLTLEVAENVVDDKKIDKSEKKYGEKSKMKEEKRNSNDKTEGSKKIIKKIRNKKEKVLKENEKKHQKVGLKRKEKP